MSETKTKKNTETYCSWFMAKMEKGVFAERYDVTVKLTFFQYKMRNILISSY